MNLLIKPTLIVFFGVAMLSCTNQPTDTTGNNSSDSRDTDDSASVSAQPASAFLKKYQGHAPAGFMGDRRIRPGNYIQMDVLVTTRNFINIWIPESCTYNGQEEPFFLLSPDQLNDLKIEETPTGGISLSGKAGPELELTGTAEEFQYGLYLTVTYHNVSDRMLQDVSSAVCIQLTAAPDFRDPDRERTFWYHNNAWDNTFEYYSVEQEGIERTDFYNAAVEDESDMPLLIIESQNDDHVIGLIFRDATGVGGNSQMSTGCMHSDGGLVDIGPGESAAREGILIIHPEGKDALLKIAKEFYDGSV
ncbi:MAG: hypothetical protein ABFS38_19105 [Bacteroidota bacterium]